MTLHRIRLAAVVLVLALLLAACTSEPGGHDSNVALRFAVLGDAEPKPEPEFPNMAAAVEDVNSMAESMQIDFVVGVGDIAHKGTVIQYENATTVLESLKLPFYPIMGNEEHGSTVERYLQYANRWGQDKPEIAGPSYVVETDTVALVLASPDHGRDFDDQGIDWILNQIRQLQPKPVLLVVHGAQTGVYPENADKGITHERFDEVIQQPNLAAVISGDLHMDMDRVVHSREIDGVHYLHIPALERTKIPDESNHTPMFRVFTLEADGRMLVETFEVGVAEPLARHEYRFDIDLGAAASSETTRSRDSVNGTATRQTAFRIRSDIDQSLNADSGWAAEINEDAIVNVDDPFRIRFELEAAGHSTPGQKFQLQARRNSGEWVRVGAENFPQPEKLLTLDSSGEAGFGDASGVWRLDSGEAVSLTVADDGALEVSAGQDPVLGILTREPTWTPVELALYVRFPQDRGTGTGLVFAYRDPGNHHRVDLDADGTIQLSRVAEGDTTSLMQRQIDVPEDQWLELKVIVNGNDVIVEFDDDALEVSTRMETGISLSPVGFHVPADSTVQFRDIVIEGEPRSPRVSIMASEQFQHGQSTADLLDRSDEAFVAGAGISFADQTPRWSGVNAQGEWEWPLVIRRFADGAVTNNTGDTFEFRMADESGEPISSNQNPAVTVAVPPGHIGGTFVETPARVGPWQASNGDLYFLMEPSETYNVLMTVKSSDGGETWQEIDGSNRPATGDLEGFASFLVGGSIHMLHQTSDDVLYHVVNTSDHPEQPDRWVIRDEWLASPMEPPTQVADIVVRSDGSIVGVYGGPERIHFKTRSVDGSWGEETVIDAATPPRLSGPMMALGQDDMIHLAYTGDDGTAWYRRILPDGSLSPRQQVATGLGTDSDDVGSILPLVFIPETNTVSIIYRLASGFLWERRSTDHRALTEPVQVSDRRVVQNAVDSDQAGADAIADGQTVHVLFIEQESGSIFHARSERAGAWSEAVPVAEDVNAQWVRGARLSDDQGQFVYGFIYDAGSFGGSGMNRYDEIRLVDP